LGIIVNYIRTENTQDGAQPRLTKKIGLRIQKQVQS